ncbi:MAG TPA: hypothetical protein VFB31_03255 [Pseudolabrys sp.]|nr:hypothetical protein [Pseudolabrys sp.]
MKLLAALRRLFAVSWLIAAPLILIGLFIGVPLLLAIIGAIIGRLFGPEAAEAFAELWFGAMMWAGEIVLLLAPAVVIVYLGVRIVRRRAAKKAP